MNSKWESAKLRVAHIWTIDDDDDDENDDDDYDDDDDTSDRLHILNSDYVYI